MLNRCCDVHRAASEMRHNVQSSKPVKTVPIVQGLMNYIPKKGVENMQSRQRQFAATPPSLMELTTLSVSFIIYYSSLHYSFHEQVIETKHEIKFPIMNSLVLERWEPS